MKQRGMDWLRLFRWHSPKHLVIELVQLEHQLGHLYFVDAGIII